MEAEVPFCRSREARGVGTGARIGNCSMGRPSDSTRKIYWFVWVPEGLWSLPPGKVSPAIEVSLKLDITCNSKFE